MICCLPEKTLGTRLGVPLALIEEPADSVQASTAVKRKSNYVTNLVSPESVYKEKFVRNIRQEIERPKANFISAKLVDVSYLGSDYVSRVGQVSRAGSVCTDVVQHVT